MFCGHCKRKVRISPCRAANTIGFRCAALYLWFPSESPPLRPAPAGNAGGFHPPAPPKRAAGDHFWLIAPFTPALERDHANPASHFVHRTGDPAPGQSAQPRSNIRAAGRSHGPARASASVGFILRARQINHRARSIHRRHMRGSRGMKTPWVSRGCPLGAGTEGWRITRYP